MITGVGNGVGVGTVVGVGVDIGIFVGDGVEASVLQAARKRVLMRTRVNVRGIKEPLAMQARSG